MMYSMIPFGRYHGGLDTIFDDLERSFFPPANRQPTAFRTDIRDEGDHFLLEAELPGFQKEDIHLELKEGVLTISAQHEEKQEKRDDQGQYLCRERRVGSFVRSFDASGIQEDAIRASYENGVLTLILPKMADIQPQSRRIAIQ